MSPTGGDGGLTRVLGQTYPATGDACAMQAEVPPNLSPAGLHRRRGGGDTFASFYPFYACEERCEGARRGDYPLAPAPPSPSGYNVLAEGGYCHPDPIVSQHSLDEAYERKDPPN